MTGDNHASGSSENDTDYSSNSFGSSSSPVRSAKKKIRKIKRMVADNQMKANSDRSEEFKLRIQAKIEEQKSAVRFRGQQQREWEEGTKDPFGAMATMLSLTEDIEEMELEAQKLLEELENAKKENAKPKQEQKQKPAPPIKEGFDQEFLESRIAELEVENKILMTRLQSGQATVDSIRADISSIASSNQECKKALREAKAASGPLHLEQENLRTKIQEAEEELQALQDGASHKQTARKVEKDQKQVFEQAAREILDLQRNHRLKKQISQRKLQQRQHQKQKQQQMLQMQQQNVLPPQTQAKPVERTIKRQTSWWQLDTPERAPKESVSIKNFHSPSKMVSEDSDIAESESSDIDTI